MTEPSQTIPDTLLVDQAKSGNNEAFDKLIRRHRAAILGLVRRYVRAPEQAEDVAQKSFLLAYERLESFQGAASFRTWLHRIAVHQALNHIRGVREFAPIEVDDVPAFTNALDTARLAAGELWRKVSAFLPQLPPQQRLAVELRLFHELSFAEIGACADCTAVAARGSFYQGMKRLRSEFGAM